MACHSSSKSAQVAVCVPELNSERQGSALWHCWMLAVCAELNSLEVCDKYEDEGTRAHSMLHCSDRGRLPACASRHLHAAAIEHDAQMQYATASAPQLCGMTCGRCVLCCR